MPTSGWLAGKKSPTWRVSVLNSRSGILAALLVTGPHDTAAMLSAAARLGADGATGRLANGARSQYARMPREPWMIALCHSIRWPARWRWSPERAAALAAYCPSIWPAVAPSSRLPPAAADRGRLIGWLLHGDEAGPC